MGASVSVGWYFGAPTRSAPDVWSTVWDTSCAWISHAECEERRRGGGRRLRPLGPLSIEIDAPRDLVFDVIAEPYAERTSRAAQEKVRVLERGQDMVLAAHYTPIRGRLKATTVETVHFERPHRIGFRLVRGPVPYVVETFTLEQDGDRTWLSYTGELGTDLWRLGVRWGDVVSPKWESVVASSFRTVKTEAERRGANRRRD
ncbi:MAG: SRPBCC family protein [Nocardioidaceae bacterium]|nr:SRPBCC family protein [Nocardioidaceae bacterium]